MGFTESKYLKHHIRSVHEGNKPHQCTFCDKKFSERSNFNRHITNVHDVKMPYSCNICETNFSLYTSLRNHIKTAHEETMSYQIKIVEEGKISYKCSICHEGFALKTNLEKHVASEHQIQIFNQKVQIDSKLYIRLDPRKCEVKLPIQQIHILNVDHPSVTVENTFQKNGWACKVCEPEENFEHKFQMVTHLHEKHSEGLMYEPCQWCCELFKSPDQEKVSPIFKIL